MGSMFPILCLATGGLVFFLLYKFFLLPAYLSPVSKIPNAHFSSPLSPIWILWIRRQGIENRTLLACHERLGPIVRLGPSELSVNCVDGGVRTIYSGGYEKHQWYPNLFLNYGVPNMFSTANSKPHSIRKRMISNVYSKSYIQNSQDMNTISQVVIFQRLLPILESSAASGAAVDVLELNFSAAMDFITAWIFGLASGSNLLQDVPFRKWFLNLYYCRKPYTFWPQEAPGLMNFLSKFGITVIPDFVGPANRKIEEWCSSMCKLTQAALDTGRNQQQPGNSAVVYSQLEKSLRDAPTKSNTDTLSYPIDLTIASDMLDHLSAGHETSGITLTYLMHELSKHPALQISLRAELLTLTPATLQYNPIDPLSATLPDLPSPRIIDTLPLLHAVMLETLRLYAAIPGPQPRVTPPIPTTLAGYNNIPPNTRVSALPYALHRNSFVFSEPYAWKPDRWLEAGKERKEEMMRWFWAFGSGGRMCIGSNFAMQGKIPLVFYHAFMYEAAADWNNWIEMKLIIAAIYTKYTTHVVDDEGMEQADGYTVGPVGNKLILRFEKVGGL